MQENNKVNKLLLERTEQEEKEKQRIQDLKIAYASLFSTNEGICVLTHIYELLNFETVKGSPLEPQVLAYIQSKRDTWASIKDFLPREARIKVEIGG